MLKVRMRYGRALAASGCILVWLAVAEAAAAQDRITIDISDWGINQHWSPEMKVGGSFVRPDPGDSSRPAHNRARPELDATPAAQILIPMPTDREIGLLSLQDLTRQISRDLTAAYERGRAQGIDHFEFQIVQNVNAAGYFDEGRQRLAQHFGAAAYGAIGNLVGEVRGAHELVLNANLASNGTHLFAKNTTSWGSYADAFQHVDMADGRALLPDMRNVLDRLGGSRVSITNTRGDYWAPSLGVAGMSRSKGVAAIHASIGNADTVQQLVQEYPEVRSFVLTPLDNAKPAHIRRMIDPGARFQVEQQFWTGTEVKRQPLAGIHTPADLRRYGRSSAAGMPAVSDRPASPPLQILRGRAETLAADTAALSTVLKELNRRKSLDHPAIERVFGPARKGMSDALGHAQDLYDVSLAIERDMAAAGQGRFVLLQSRTVEAAARVALGGLVEADLGAADLVTAGARHIGSGGADVDTWETYLVGANKTAWGALGLVVGKGDAKTAKAFQELGDALRHTGTRVSRGWFEGRAMRGNADSYAEMWETVQTARASHGLPIQGVEKFFGTDVARKTFSSKQLQQLDQQRLELAASPARQDAIPQISTTVADVGRLSPRERREIEMATRLAPAHARRVAVVGVGPGADALYRQTEARFGHDRVMRIRTSQTTYRTQRRARDFGADVILGVDLHDPTARFPRRRRNDPPPPDNRHWIWGGGPGGPRPPPGGGPPRRFPSPAAAEPPRFEIPRVEPNRYGVGGVMLRGSAEVSGGSVEIGASGFDLVLDNAQASLEVGSLRRFVTALWAVYLGGDEGPGVSIDPIAPDVDKHLVRYIGGAVLNLDLARVMREADYTMKKWAVGTERPDFAGFENPDDIAGRMGSVRENRSRFWFVPEGLRFRKAGQALLFDGGRITLRTEYLGRSHGADPANEVFAEQFTEHYEELAAHEPALDELFRYAKLVGLARHLKDQRVPLLWYLLANKDLILTEDSPGVVDAFARRSEYFDYIEIRGGVDLEVPMSPARYVLDSHTMKALLDARARRSAARGAGGRPGAASPARPIILDDPQTAITFTPAGSITLAGTNHAGEPFQTDLALRREGQPHLEITRYFDPSLEGVPGFGDGWHLLIPYRIFPHGEAMVPLLNVEVPAQLVVENLLTREREVLAFSEDRYSAAGWVPDEGRDSGLVGVFPLTDGTYRLVDKAGADFQFDPSGHLTDMLLTDEYVVHFEYEWLPVDDPATTYRLEPEGEGRVEVANVTVPRSLLLIDSAGTRRRYDHDPDSDVVAWSPAGPEAPFDALEMMTDGSFRLQDRRGTIVELDPAGEHRKTLRKAVTRLSQGSTEAKLRYERSGGDLAVVSLDVRDEKSGDQYALGYRYEPGGKLARVRGPSGRVAEVEYGAGAVRLSRR